MYVTLTSRDLLFNKISSYIFAGLYMKNYKNDKIYL